MSSSLFLEAGFSNNTEYYTNEYREGIEKPRGTRGMVRQRHAKNDLDLGGYTKAGPSTPTESPKALYWNAAATYVKGDHTIKIGANNRWARSGTPATRNADLGAAVPQPARRSLARARHGADSQLPRSRSANA